MTNILVSDTNLSSKEVEVCRTVPGHAEHCKYEEASEDRNIVYTISANKKVCIQFNGKRVADAKYRTMIEDSLTKSGYTMDPGRCDTHGYSYEYQFFKENQHGIHITAWKKHLDMENGPTFMV